jgi:hypothetical protein
MKEIFKSINNAFRNNNIITEEVVVGRQNIAKMVESMVKV